MADGLAKLLRLRRHDRDVARRRLSQAVAAESSAAVAEDRAQAALAEEASTADAWAFAAWLPAAHREIARRAAARAGAAADSDAAALALRAAETAFGILDDLSARRSQITAERDKVAEQARLDEIATRGAAKSRLP